MRLLIIFVFFLFGCVDPPLLKTGLPNGYSFHSNGGIYGYISTPNDQRMYEYFGMLDNSEQWCNNFGWDSNFVICELEIVKENASGGYEFKYLILNTGDGTVYIKNSISEAEFFWKSVPNGSFPEMLAKHQNTVRK
ncbi:hypothetical protein [Agarivorans sp. Alg241-V36]|uniref:hypothetical protein n=1 Tax=Agarivorans sp. Alg241-V36 TaxID=2305992 RepID=UPI0013D6E1AC|nr:hypothetical protein [Agarivorans sp. Alg241-V36]